MHVSTIIVSAASPALQLALAIIMLLRNLHRHFPCFFVYTVFSVAVIVPRLAAGNPVRTFVVFWTTELIFGVLALLAIREAFSLELEAISGLYRWFRFFPAIILLLI